MARTHEAKPVLAALMERNGWEPQELAVHGGVPIDTLRKWLAGTNNPTGRRLSEVVARSGADPAEFNLRPIGPPATEQASAWLAEFEQRQIQRHEQQMAALADIQKQLATLRGKARKK